MTESITVYKLKPDGLKTISLMDQWLSISLEMWNASQQGSQLSSVFEKSSICWATSWSLLFSSKSWAASDNLNMWLLCTRNIYFVFDLVSYPCHTIAVDFGI